MKRMTSWVRFSIAVYAGLLMAGSLSDHPTDAASQQMLDRAIAVGPVDGSCGAEEHGLSMTDHARCTAVHTCTADRCFR